MNLNHIAGNVFQTPKETLKIQCISADLAMGAGIALQFNKEYDMKNKIRSRFTNNKAVAQYLKTQGFCIFERPVFNLVTKEHYFDKPTYQTLRRALEDMRLVLDFLLIDTEYTKEKPLQIVCPEIGCGLDQLEVNKVIQLLYEVLDDLPIEITMYSYDKEKQHQNNTNQNMELKLSQTVMEFQKQQKALQRITEITEKYKYRNKIPKEVSDMSKQIYKENIPTEWINYQGGPIYSKDGVLLANQLTDRHYVCGEYGVYLEIDDKDIVKDNIKVKPGQEYRIDDEKYAKNIKYQWFAPIQGEDAKLYFQQRTVNYADYKEGKWYVSPYEVTTKEKDNTRYFNMQEANQHAEQKLFKLLIAGSRTFAMADKEVEKYVEDTVLKLLTKKQNDGYQIEIIQGGAAGADDWGHRFANSHHFKETIMKADWNKYKNNNKKNPAGMIRNKQMFEYITKDNAECGCILLWDGESRGTNHDIQLAKEYNVQTKIMLFDSRYPEIDTCKWMNLSKLEEYSKQDTLNLINQVEYDLE